MRNPVWVITRELNEYDQFGEYFVCLFNKIKPPSLNNLREALPELDRATLEHIQKGGGRRGYEYEWYHLRRVESK